VLVLARFPGQVQVVDEEECLGQAGRLEDAFTMVRKYSEGAMRGRDV
jgi:hypothetical protein